MQIEECFSSSLLSAVDHFFKIICPRQQFIGAVKASPVESAFELGARAAALSCVLPVTCSQYKVLESRGKSTNFSGT